MYWNGESSDAKECTAKMPSTGYLPGSKGKISEAAVLTHDGYLDVVDPKI